MDSRLNATDEVLRSFVKCRGGCDSKEEVFVRSEKVQHAKASHQSVRGKEGLVFQRIAGMMMTSSDLNPTQGESKKSSELLSFVPHSFFSCK
jgi:hypothetical protein